MKYYDLTKQVFFILFLCISALCRAQGYLVTAANADCENPIILTDTIYGPTNAPAGYGTTKEFQALLGNFYSFEKEHNSVWFKFVSPVSGALSLDIIPLCIKDDYDFLLFKYAGNESGFCENIKTNNLKPIRSVISRNDKSIASLTGLKAGFSDEFIHSGPGISYGKPVDVQKNEVYYIVLDNVYEYGCGFTLKLHFLLTDVINSLNITLLDSLTGEMINGNIDVAESGIIDSLKRKKSQKNISSFFMPVDSLHAYLITASSKGYFSKSMLYKPNAVAGAFNLKINLQKIQVGKKIVLDNIYFYGNSDEFLPTSKQALEGLLGTMNDNPGLKIEVQGHVNWPYNANTQPDTTYNRILSVSRAKAVCKYLTDNNIDEDRLAYRGFGNKAMLFPFAKSKEEMEKNRRVEILVTSNDE